MDGYERWKMRTLFLGGLVGAVTGLGAAYLLVRRSEEAGRAPEIGVGEGLRLGLLLLGLLRQVGELSSRDEG